jgi:lipopolysaccharide biosynthesis glycosyltransferase
MDETLPLFQRYRAMFSLRNKVKESRIENNAFLRLQMLWRVEKDIVTSDTDILQQLLMDETLPMFQRYRAMFTLRNKVNDSRIQLKRTSSQDFI